MVEPPFLYLQIKHQRSYLQDLVNKLKCAKSLEELSQDLKSVGQSKMDLYTGQLTTKQITEEIKNQLRHSGHFEPTDYQEWLNENDGYQTLCISDGSTWTLRLGNKTEQYIHLHPGRHSKDTIRVNAGVLKTAILAVAAFHQGKIETIDQKSINDLRVNYLNLSPIKWKKSTSQISTIIDLLVDSM